MDRNTYFMYWIKRYGMNKFVELSKKVCRKITVPLEIKQKGDADTFLFHYFFMVYLIVALDYLKLDVKQMEFIMDLSVTPAVSRLFPPSKVLEVQKDNISELLSYIKKDLELYYKN